MHLTLQHWTLLLALPLLLTGIVKLAAPATAGHLLKGFPRSRVAGYLLSSIALAWAGWLLYAMPLEFLVPYRRYIPFVMLAAIPFAWYAMPDLLASRSLGGLFVLLPAPILQVARVYPSEWRLVVVTLLYLMALVGMTLIMAPYYHRDTLEWLSRSKLRLRLCGLCKLLLAALLLWLAVAVFVPQPPAI